MLQDVKFFSFKLGKIEGSGDAGDFLTEIVNSKEVKPKTPEPFKAGIATAENEKDEDDTAVSKGKTSSSSSPTKEDDKTNASPSTDDNEAL